MPVSEVTNNLTVVGASKSNPKAIGAKKVPKAAKAPKAEKVEKAAKAPKTEKAVKASDDTGDQEA